MYIYLERLHASIYDAFENRRLLLADRINERGLCKLPKRVRPTNGRTDRRTDGRTHGRSDGGISVYTPKISLPYKFYVVTGCFFFSLTQDKFDIEPVCALARVSFTYLHTTIYTSPQMKFLATPLVTYRSSCRCPVRS